LENQEAAEKLWDYIEVYLKNERHSAILEMRFRLNQTRDYIAEHFHLTKDRIRQIEIMAIQKLRQKHSMREVNIMLGRNPNYMIQNTTGGD
jgi:DNA-directed RNA polymerase sigma subunit (sigma70/sigma32)